MAPGSTKFVQWPHRDAILAQQFLELHLGFCTVCRGKAPVVVVGILWVSVGADEVLDVLTPHHDAGYLIWEWADPTGLTRE